MNPPLIEFKSVNLGYGNQTVLKNISCSIAKGDSIGLVGQNGSGKTTFLKAILGNLKPSSGEIHVDASQRFAYVPQIDALDLFWPLTVAETVLLPAKASKIFGRAAKEEIENAKSAMAKVGVEKISSTLLRDASGGQRQKTILAQALAQTPGVLLLDEPTKGLDVVAERDFLELISRLEREKDMTVLFVTHSLEIPLNYMERIFLFHAGSVIPTTSNELLKTKLLEEIYGVPFTHHNQDGVRWVMPARNAS